MDKKYSQHFSEKSLWDKLKQFGKTAGAKVVYAVLLLLYTFQDKGVSTKTKLSIAAALGYFILPTDAIIDLTPIIGYSDDLGVLLFTLSAVATSITPEIKAKARKKAHEWFGAIDPQELNDIDNQTF
ncbi:DUF1232 domain-containing protein [uncultured Draconibacterium sp.]|uniref:YkvA family protein n=1 Tax=uncultured Draconibacterium sp. TaxID=1573823 RepID=UPI0025E75AA6|nr:DUF1232 domain-containing protein [uncultured Draconibacterium sp.]